ILCFVADPVLFTRRSAFTLGGGVGPLEEFRVAWYAFSVFEFAVIGFALSGRIRNPGLAAVGAGVLFVGGGVSLGLGLVLLPLSIIGLVMIIGVLGLTPFWTGFAYLRTAGALVDHASKAEPESRHWPLVLAGVFAAVLFTAAIQAGADQYTDQVIARLSRS